MLISSSAEFHQGSSFHAAFLVAFQSFFQKSRGGGPSPIAIELPQSPHPLAIGHQNRPTLPPQPWPGLPIPDGPLDFAAFRFRGSFSSTGVSTFFLGGTSWKKPTTERFVGCFSGAFRFRHAGTLRWLFCEKLELDAFMLWDVPVYDLAPPKKKYIYIYISISFQIYDMLCVYDMLHPPLLQTLSSKSKFPWTPIGSRYSKTKRVQQPIIS